MKCPLDGTELAMTERQGIEIDYCPKCRGVWLDRGELDKILERSSAGEPAESSRAQRAQPVPDVRYRDDRSRDDRNREDRGREDRGREDRGREDRVYESRRPYKKKKSLLDDIFDF